MTIVFDLDGTLIDSSERMYRLFKKLIPECDYSKTKYWDLKRNKINHKMILEMDYPQYDFCGFNQNWMNLIEKEEYLNMDVNYEDTIEMLEYLRNKEFSIVLLTARQSIEELNKELKRLGIIDYFDIILSTRGIEKKEILLSNAIKDGDVKKHEEDLFVSDMGKDILCGAALGYKTVAISHGFMSPNRLREYNPSFIIEDLQELKGIVN